MTKSSFPSDAAEKFVLRFPTGMRSRIAEAAKSNARSMNSEIIHRLALSLDADDIKNEPPMNAMVDLPPGATIDHGVQVWAERLVQPGNRADLEGLLSVIRAILRGAGRLDPGPDGFDEPSEAARNGNKKPPEGG